VRLHLSGWSGEGRSSIERSASRLAGVLSASANVRTRNLLVHFDPSVLTAEEIRLAAEQALIECRGAVPLQDSTYRAVFRVTCYGVVAHVAVDLTFYTIAFAGPFGMVGHAMGAAHLAIDSFIWLATLTSALWLLLASREDTAAATATA
jgi:hypothetical protein